MEIKFFKKNSYFYIPISIILYSGVKFLAATIMVLYTILFAQFEFFRSGNYVINLYSMTFYYVLLMFSSFFGYWLVCKIIPNEAVLKSLAGLWLFDFIFTRSSYFFEDGLTMHRVISDLIFDVGLAVMAYVVWRLVCLNKEKSHE